MLAVKVLPKFAESVRRQLAEKGLINNNYEIKKENGYIFIPLIETAQDIRISHGSIVNAVFSRRRIFPKKLSEAVGIKGLRAFDVVGDIAIIEVPEKYRNLEEKIGEAILNLHKNIKTVVAKGSCVHGEYRVREVRHIAGDRKTITYHKEHGCVFKIDVSKIYFSPRLSHERLRIANQVKDGEHILALFAGVAPFPIIIAKRKNVIAYSIELNPLGHEYAIENIKMNKVSGRVIAVKGDVKEILKDEKFNRWADRIIMPLPKDAVNFIPYVIHAAKSGCIMHIYLFCRRDGIERMESKVLELIGRPAKVIGMRKVRTYSPEKDQYVMDVKIS